MSDIRLTRELTQRGFSADEIWRLTRDQQLRRVRRGAYAVPSTEDLDPRLAHLELIEATISQSSTEAVVSHVSAAALHGLPLWAGQLARVHLTRDRAGGGRVRRYTQVHGLPLDAEDIVMLNGTAVTSLARTVFDLACCLPMERSVPVGDAALRLGLDPDQLDVIAGRAARRHGINAARRAIAFLDERSESPGESTSRVVLHHLGLPPPELQLEVFGPSGQLVGRCDFGWSDKRTLGEFDGRVKYGRLLKPGQAPGDVVFDEKRREDALRDLDWQLARWITADLSTPQRLRDRVLAAFARGQRHH